MCGSSMEEGGFGFRVPGEAPDLGKMFFSASKGRQIAVLPPRAGAGAARALSGSLETWRQH
jgi:hypothetical protein